MPERPSSVPDAAWWSPQDNEWILGAKDSEGRLVGEVTYWRPDGSLVCKCDHVAGKPHGRSRRFHETGEVAQDCQFVDGELHGLRAWWMTDGVTTEKPRHEAMATNVWRGELDYDRGTVVGFRLFDRDGVQVTAQGRPVAARPPNVPATATQNNAGKWTLGAWNEKGEQVGTQTFWSASGVLETEQVHAGELVKITEYRGDGSVRVRYSQRMAAHLVGDAEAFRRDGSLSVRATFGETSTIEHLGVGGTSVRSTSYHPIATEPLVAGAVPDLGDRHTFDALDEGDVSAIDDAHVLSPAGMAHAIARGWGGTEERDAKSARLLRKLVQKVAPASLAALLAKHELDRVPRLQTPLRVETVVEALSAETSIDLAALRAQLIDAGGPAQMLALRDPARALAYLESRLSEKRETLQLANLALTELPSAIGRFHDVPRLYAEGNRLTTLPDEVGDMFRLSWLNLARNQIATLPRTLAWLPNLRTLYLTGNKLAAIPSTVFELSDLTTLSIGDNELTELPEAIGDLTDLADLSLYENQLRDLPRSLAKLPLTFLHLGDHDWEEPPAVVGECMQLETLWIASPALTRLPAAICKLPKLKALMLWYSNVAEIPDELYEATHLEELRIENNPLPDAVYARLREALPNTRIF